MRNAAALAVCTAIAAAIALAPPAVAQDQYASPEEVLLGSSLRSSIDSANRSHPKLSSNIALASQVGSGNTISISQSASPSLVRKNVAAVAQLGDTNSFQSIQDGHFNATAAVQQGAENTMLSEQYGGFNVFAGAQIGDQLGFVIRQYGGSVVGVIQTNPQD